MNDDRLRQLANATVDGVADRVNVDAELERFHQAISPTSSASTSTPPTTEPGSRRSWWLAAAAVAAIGVGGIAWWQTGGDSTVEIVPATNPVASTAPPPPTAPPPASSPPSTAPVVPPFTAPSSTAPDSSAPPTSAPAPRLGVDRIEVGELAACTNLRPPITADEAVDDPATMAARLSEHLTTVTDADGDITTLVTEASGRTMDPTSHAAVDLGPTAANESATLLTIDTYNSDSLMANDGSGWTLITEERGIDSVALQPGGTTIAATASADLYIGTLGSGEFNPVPLPVDGAASVLSVGRSGAVYVSINVSMVVQPEFAWLADLWRFDDGAWTQLTHLEGDADRWSIIDGAVEIAPDVVWASVSSGLGDGDREDLSSELIAVEGDRITTMTLLPLDSQLVAASPTEISLQINSDEATWHLISIATDDGTMLEDRCGRPGSAGNRINSPELQTGEPPAGTHADIGFYYTAQRPGSDDSLVVDTFGPTGMLLGSTEEQPAGEPDWELVGTYDGSEVRLTPYSEFRCANAELTLGGTHPHPDLPGGTAAVMRGSLIVITRDICGEDGWAPGAYSELVAYDLSTPDQPPVVLATAPYEDAFSRGSFEEGTIADDPLEPREIGPDGRYVVTAAMWEGIATQPIVHSVADPGTAIELPTSCGTGHQRSVPTFATAELLLVVHDCGDDPTVEPGAEQRLELIDVPNASVVWSQMLAIEPHWYSIDYGVTAALSNGQPAAIVSTSTETGPTQAVFVNEGRMVDITQPAPDGNALNGYYEYRFDNQL